MPLNKKIIAIFSIIILVVTFFSGCILDGFLGAASFSLNSYEIIDDDGFPAISMSFACKGRVNLKTYDSKSNRLDYDFFYDDSETNLNIGEYRESLESGKYKFEVTDKNNKVIFQKDFSFKGMDITIDSCEQEWWKDGNVFTLIGLKIHVENFGDLPAYPRYVDIIVGTETFSGDVVPGVILPNKGNYVYCSLIHEGEFDQNTFQVLLKDKYNTSVALGTFNFDVKSTVPTWSYKKGVDSTLKIPYPEFLHDYYYGLDRVIVEDYSVFVIDSYDDEYLDFVIQKLIEGFDFGEYRFNLESDSDKINYITGFVQALEYSADDPNNDSFEYPRYPIETLFNGVGGGDCEDKSILAASLLERIGYEVALLRLPEHMAVGVKLEKNDIPNYGFYTKGYYYLETTTEGKPCGFIPNDYKSPSELYLYPIIETSFVTHNWKDDLVTIFLKTEQGDFVKVVAFVDNLGDATAENVDFKALFYTDSGFVLASETTTIGSIQPFDREKVVLQIERPSSDFDAWFETRVIVDNEVVDTQKSKNAFN